MFEEILPVSKRRKYINPMYFRDSMHLARFIHEDNDAGLGEYLDSFFDMRDLHIIDKLFICLTARKLFIDDKIRLKGTSDIDIPIHLMLNKLKSKSEERVYDVNGLKLTCDIPNRFSFIDISSECIKSVHALNTTINLRELDDESRDLVISKLPSGALRIVHEYIRSLSPVCKLLDARPKMGLDEISINLLSTDPITFVKLMFSDYSLNYFRESIVLLGQTIGTEMISYSTLADVRFYLDEISRNNSSGKADIPL